MIQIHVWTETGAEREDVGNLSDPDRCPQPLRHLIAVDRRDLGRIQYRLDPYLATRTGQEVHELIEGQRAAVFGPDDRVTGTQSGLGQVEVEYGPRSRRLGIKGRRRFHRQ